MNGRSPYHILMERTPIWTGIDVGSTTVKIVLIEPKTGGILHSSYRRHNTEQVSAVCAMLEEAHALFPHRRLIPSVCGSGGMSVARGLKAFYVQEVVANSIAVRSIYDDVRVAVELGGQDAKVIFFSRSPSTGELVATDMRMNGSCAGGTGAFIDQIAELLGVAVGGFNTLAEAGNTVYDISGRCGVFAKTDIQPLLNQGVRSEDIALSTFHAIAKQTIGGLAQGMDITPPVIFEGGPLTFNPVLISVFKERLGLEDREIIVPENPELFIARGAALSIGTMFAEKESEYPGRESLEGLKHSVETGASGDNHSAELFFSSPAEREDFNRRHEITYPAADDIEPGRELRVYLGIDAGSTTTKFVLLDEAENVVDRFYSNNHGDPLKVAKHGLLELKGSYERKGVLLEILGVGTTGYGENLFARAFRADHHTVETVAHAEAARKYAPGATFILDIGGQDMKAIALRNGIITSIVLNEACSAGCGSFIETYARSLGVLPEKIAETAFGAKNPSRLGSRCTVFMNSSIITEQKNGKTSNDILAGISRSIIENVFTKVLRISNLDSLGDTIVVQGGTFKNDAVLRAFEQYLPYARIIRPPFPGEMGAIGIALLTKRKMEEHSRRISPSTFIGLEAIEDFEYRKEPGHVCTFCANNCSRTLVTFNDGSTYITGNRCERGQILGDIKDPKTRSRLKEAANRLKSIPDLFTEQNRLLFMDYGPRQVGRKKNITIGIPRCLEFWASIPFWKTFFESLGFDVALSRRSSYDLYERGLRSIPSDTVCFPAKLAHGHVKDLIERNVDRIFMPMMVRIPKENRTAHGNHVCSIVQGYPVVIEGSDEPEKKYGIPFDNPTFHWYNQNLKYKQTIRYFSQEFGIPRLEVFRAMKEGDKAMARYYYEMTRRGREVLEQIGKKYDFGVVLAGRPYHGDELINHSLSSHFTRRGVPVLVLDALPNLHKQDLSNVRIETTIPFHARMIEGTISVAKNPNLELVQMTSFGCGHDAVISDEMQRILRETSGKELLVLKLDESEVQGPLRIRIKSFLETVRTKRKNSSESGRFAKFRELKEAFTTKFLTRDKGKTILAPNLSPAFSKIMTEIMRKEGFNMLRMPLADEKALELGKKYVHNDICFPAQVNIGEALAVITSGEYDPDILALALAKNCEDCRAGQYAALARKALDEAGYPQIPIMTTGSDTKNMHPGAKFSPMFQIRGVWGIAMMDALEYMKRSIRPYETVRGKSEEIFELYLGRIAESVPHGHRKALKLLEESVAAFNAIPVDRNKRRPRVGIVGEILLNYHPVSNGNIEKYLEENGMEVVIPSMLDFFRRSYTIEKNKAQRNLLPNPLWNLIVAGISDKVIAHIKGKVDTCLEGFRFPASSNSIDELVGNIEDLIDVSYIVGEGWLMPAEIIQMIKHGVGSFVIVQPFGCLPNHITGRGMIKSIKSLYPQVQILSLDYDPDTSFANVENRLQMLIITAKELFKKSGSNREKAS